MLSAFEPWVTAVSLTSPALSRRKWTKLVRSLIGDHHSQLIDGLDSSFLIIWGFRQRCARMNQDSLYNQSFWSKVVQPFFTGLNCSAAEASQPPHPALEKCQSQRVSHQRRPPWFRSTSQIGVNSKLQAGWRGLLRTFDPRKPFLLCQKCAKFSPYSSCIITARETIPVNFVVGRRNLAVSFSRPLLVCNRSGRHKVKSNLNTIVCHEQSMIWAPSRAGAPQLGLAEFGSSAMTWDVRPVGQGKGVSTWKWPLVTRICGAVAAFVY